MQELAARAAGLQDRRLNRKHTGTEPIVHVGRVGRAWTPARSRSWTSRALPLRRSRAHSVMARVASTGISAAISSRGRVPATGIDAHIAERITLAMHGPVGELLKGAQIFERRSAARAKRSRPSAATSAVRRRNRGHTESGLAPLLGLGRRRIHTFTLNFRPIRRRHRLEAILAVFSALLFKTRAGGRRRGPCARGAT